MTTKLHLVRHADGAFAPANGNSTHSLDISDPVLDDGNIWDRSLVVIVNAHFPDGGVQMMHYHPGRLRSAGRSIIDLADLLVRFGLVRFGSRAVGVTAKAGKGLGAVSSGIAIFSDKNHLVADLQDAKNYPEEGYYIGKELIIRGKLHSRS